MSERHVHNFILLIVCAFLLCGILPGNVFGAGSSVEDRIKALEESNKRLEETVKALELKATRTQDVIDIMCLQARYEAIHTSQESLTWMLFADRPDSTYEITHSRIIGFENIKLYLTDQKKLMELYRAGKLPEGTTIFDFMGIMSAAGGTPSGGAASTNTVSGSAPSAGKSSGGAASDRLAFMGVGIGGMPAIHPVSTPNIIVADDGKTAKATFTSLGMERGGWCYGKYANDYIKIDGKWYIWHEKWLRGFDNNFYKSWNDQTIDEIFEWVQERDETGFPIVDKNLSYNYLWYPGKKSMTITAPHPYKTWTKEDDNGGWWKRPTVTP